MSEIDIYEWEDKKDDTTFKEHMIAGCIAGIAEHVCMLPMDNIKTHSQLLRKTRFSDMIQVIYEQGGIRQFWRGTMTVICGCGPAHAAFFSVYEYSKWILNVDNENINPLLHGLTGATAVLLHDSIMTPFDVIKQRQQMLTNDNTIKNIFRQIINEEGFKSLYRSLPITLLQNIPWQFAQVASNETIKRVYCKDSEHSFYSYFCCAGISAAIASLLTIPLDNIKTRLQTQMCFEKDNFYLSKDLLKQKIIFLEPGLKKQFCTISQVQSQQQGQKKQTVKYENIIQTIQLMVKEEGARGFVKGVFPRVLSTVPSSAVSWSIYETIKRHLQSNPYHIH